MSFVTEEQLCGMMLGGFMLGAIIGGVIMAYINYLKKSKRADKSITVNKTEFNKVGEWAIRQQRMQSFIYETSFGDYEENIKE